jgi:hypothetical protein
MTRTTLARLLGGTLPLTLAVAACGGSTAPGAPATTGAPGATGASIPSKAPYPAKASAAAQPTAEAPAKPKTIKEVCAAVKADVKVSSSSSTPRVPGDLGTPDHREGASRGSGHANAKGKYGMADLDALATKGAWEELLEHAEDVAPTARNAAWEKTVERAAMGYMDQLTTKTGAYEGIWTSQQLLKRYPHLRSSKELTVKRAEAAKIASKECLSKSYGGDHCLDMMTDFLKTSGTSPDVGMAFGRIVRANQFHYVAVPYFKWSLDQPKAEAAWCDDEDLSLAVVAGLGLPPDAENAAGARHIAAGACFAKLKAKVERAAVEDESSYTRDNVCAVLRAKGAL